MVPSGPILEIIRPYTTGISIRWIYGGERIVQRHVACDCHQDRTDKIEQAAGEQITRARFLPTNEEMASAKQHTAVPKNTAKNHLFSTTLIDCMAATPCAGGTRAKAFITKFENAKKIPATSPEPSADTTIKMDFKADIS
jgi:hypothetical protein